MKLLLHPSVFADFFSMIGSLPSDEVQEVVFGLFHNLNNKFIFNKTFINEIEKICHDKGLDPILYQEYLKNILDNKRCDNSPASSGRNIDDEIKYVYDNYRGFTLVLSKKEDGALEQNVRGAVIVDKMKKPNYHWVLAKVASLNPARVTLSYSSFSNDAQIELLFHDIFALIEHYPVNIYDRHFNIPHPLFSGIKTKFVNCYTSLVHRDESIERRKRIVSLFASGRNNVKVFQADKKYVHERKIIFGDIVISLDEDFTKTNLSYPTWEIHIACCSKTVADWNGKHKYFAVA